MARAGSRWPWVALAAALLALPAAACSQGSVYEKWGTAGSLSSAGSPSSSAASASAAAQPSFASRQIQAVNQPLNHDDHSALTSADVQTLDQNGVLAPGDKPALNTMVKQ